ncbi:MAG TPA: UDP-N-acetylglucosamine 2-epimerase (non-hydrolyzing) [Jatrophihabitantaceae bacterium]|jgi:UDP-N-acetylglucosamine 2-epimerase (non-hydrolysing)
MYRVMVVYGTRPEAIKVAPVIGRLGTSPHLRPIPVVTGQHREMLDQVNQLFGIEPAHDLDIIAPRQSLQDITVRALSGLSDVIRAEQPDAVVVQGDTTTSFVAALAAFYEQIPVAHIEAGLRTANPYSPFPEEINRRLTSQVASVHLAPTRTSRANLVAENIKPERITVTGNTVIDALHEVVARRLPYADPALESLGRRMVLITAHRRESWGEPMARSARAVRRLALRYPDTTFVLPAHLNPVVREVLLPPLRDRPNVLITEPLPYGQFARLMQDSHLILTDSGGVQEEGPSLGKPVLVMRDTTERPEAVEAGTVRLVGTDEDAIVREVARLLDDDAHYAAMANAVNPYGDGQAARRSVQALEHFFGLGDPPDNFEPDA